MEQIEGKNMVFRRELTFCSHVRIYPEYVRGELGRIEEGKIVPAVGEFLLQ